ncbi:TPA: dTDP-4-dehydrorhamnose reductase [Klebsiella quasipneumoniae subsp. quasipneumoniae]|uniref:dTDP-4-dehydrorhamnose reductase n=1 Tax=Raoultella ornithinolytica TaxID=54291 RepID=UPI0015DCC548|nr:dTDP-4-dehydrorhamnose reductase [Raoultella ornithinolytica]HBR0925855.1 dTDP-4-dehydrorhamnose reductase [Klebsiella quasipneumoniae subsp. quasipneumoniae]MDK7651743.1 dTDP-4-dehydrorhamnose reductase [Raoultella ornithinolytica]MDK7660639.1 dTDP-4-dehydrorhamnose reductase [Raoultella ornithinolytica]BBQ88596.1 NAD(P)-dependent oxidoreductase [Raoultella ornithinolytica]HBR1356480.1 dTDP-4-dehydrorhamnose reductase [Klebsiella quasipneumoniae subsp. quasipneumoniae]
MKVLLTGANGQLGQCFQDRLPEGWDIWATDTSELDITNKDLVLAAVNKYKPDVIVNAAAYTAVDKAENDIDVARLVNKDGPENLAIAASKNGAILVHVSTDYVFDGRASIPYKECDDTNPLGVYGLTKLEGENAVATVLPNAIILRTAWVFSEYGNNFVKTMLRLAKDRDSLSIVSDQRGCPTYAGDIANAIILLIQNNSAGGIFHFCGDEEVSWSEFAQAIFDAAVKAGTLSQPPIINAISTEQYPTPAKRPAYSTLDCSKIADYGISASHWRKALAKITKVL